MWRGRVTYPPRSAQLAEIKNFLSNVLIVDFHLILKLILLGTKRELSRCFSPHLRVTKDGESRD